MKCPYCDQEMQSGILTGDGRSPVHFQPGDRAGGFLQRFSSTGKLTAVKKYLTVFDLPANFCKSCKKTDH